MREINVFQLAICGALFFMLICGSPSITAEDTNPPTLWRRIVAGVKNYPWHSDKPERETPENIHNKRVMWQRLTMSTVL
ncbi:uncharacterized protein LOC117894779 [Drosophila subobscura]|uniref:uncharacterized protein LOC117894779 n=1 Tax=Drosophila subobscura TaxID=7241 RepID=UPI00155AB21E|nr:uncharacterized protein LOC117894779 [Drosophila subobscura]